MEQSLSLSEAIGIAILGVMVMFVAWNFGKNIDRRFDAVRKETVHRRKTEHHSKVKAFMRTIRSELGKNRVNFYFDSVYRSKRLPSLEGESSLLPCGVYLSVCPDEKSNQICFSLQNEDLDVSADLSEQEVRRAIHKAILDQICSTVRESELMWCGQCSIEYIEEIGFGPFAYMLARSLTRYQLLHDVSRRSDVYWSFVNAHRAVLENQEKITDFMKILGTLFVSELLFARQPEPSP